MHRFRVGAHLWLRLCRQLLCVDTGDWRTTREWSRAADGVAWIVRFFYLFAAYEMSSGPLGRSYRGEPTEPLWPVELLSRSVGVDWLGNDVVVALLPTTLALLGVVFPGVLGIRLAVFVYLLVTVAFHNSYGAENHGSHFFVYVSFALLFLPRAVGRSDSMPRRDAMVCIAVFWLVQAILLLSYSLAGFWKVWVSGTELLVPDSFSRILLARLFSDAKELPVLLPLAVSHTYVGWLLFLGLVYVQCASIFVLFRPHLHRAFGIALILFHFGTVWLMNITFHYRIVFVGLFLVFSPLAPPRLSLSSTLRSLPLLGVLFSLWAATLRDTHKGGARAWLVYDGECPFCQRYAAYLDVRSAIGEFILVDARKGGLIVEDVLAKGFVLDDGMVLKIGARYYHGEDALVALALMSEKRGVFSVLNRLLLSSRRMARVAYPTLKLGRRMALAMKGVPVLGR